MIFQLERMHSYYLEQECLSHSLSSLVRAFCHPCVWTNIYIRLCSHAVWMRVAAGVASSQQGFPEDRSSTPTRARFVRIPAHTAYYIRPTRSVRTSVVRVYLRWVWLTNKLFVANPSKTHIIWWIWMMICYVFRIRIKYVWQTHCVSFAIRIAPSFARIHIIRHKHIHIHRIPHHPYSYISLTENVFIQVEENICNSVLLAENSIGLASAAAITFSSLFFLF